MKTKHDRIMEASEKYQGNKWFGTPEVWMDNPHWYCNNGHVSTRYLKSEARGCNVCLAGRCRESVIIGPSSDGDVDIKTWDPS